MKDDLVVLAPITKLGAQVISALFVVFNYKLNIESLHGFMGIEGLPAWVGAILSVVIIVGVINALNLIDGIDGLASTIGIIMFTGFGIIFYLIGKEFLMLTSLVMIGNLMAFLRYNLSKKYKIFMGDTGSMMIGFLVGVMAVRTLSVDIALFEKLPINIENLPFVVFALLIVPMFDTSRVIIIRLCNKHSPFYPDRNHIHHLILDCFGISHRRTCFYIGLINFLFVTGISILAMFTNQWILLLVFILIIVAAVMFFYSIRRPRRSHREVHNKMIKRKVHSY
jgi:UDP-N-acetylmuramyl pentapeptide phosphotransferase/UDP-N-acetylglucosamine-1-phosphate transferase